VSDLLPPNATATERAVDQTVGARIDALPVPLRQLWDPATCPTHLLPWLAWALSVDEWDSTWPEAVQREAIAASMAVHQHKGTVGAVRRAIAITGASVSLREWWQTGGPPHTFELTAWVNDNLLADNRPVLDAAVQARLRRQVEATKPARSHYTLRVGARFDDGLIVGQAAQARGLTRRDGALGYQLDHRNVLGATSAHQALTSTRRAGVLSPPVAAARNALGAAGAAQSRTVLRVELEAA